MEHIKKVALSVLAAMAAVCMAVALLFLTLPTQRVSAAPVSVGDADALQAAIDDAGEGDVIQLAAISRVILLCRKGRISLSI